jgi:hypothetical protein
MRATLILLVVCLAALPVWGDDGVVDSHAIRAAIERSLPLLQAGASHFASGPRDGASRVIIRASCCPR